MYRMRGTTFALATSRLTDRLANCWSKQTGNMLLKQRFCLTTQCCFLNFLLWHRPQGLFCNQATVAEPPSWFRDWTQAATCIFRLHCIACLRLNFHWKRTWDQPRWTNSWTRPIAFNPLAMMPEIRLTSKVCLGIPVPNCWLINWYLIAGVNDPERICKI